MTKWRIRIVDGVYRIFTPYGGCLKFSYAIGANGLSLALDEIRFIVKRHNDAMRELRAI